MRLVLLGPPGAGKGTQAARLAEWFRVPHISTGDLFRANLTQRTPLGREAKRHMDAGELVPDEVTIGMVRNRLGDRDAMAGFILDGFPRTVVQADALVSMLGSADDTLDAVILLEVPDDVLVTRLLARGRADDIEEVIRRRQEVYREETAPMFGYYQDQLIKVDAMGGVVEITSRVLNALLTS